MMKLAFPVANQCGDIAEQCRAQFGQYLEARRSSELNAVQHLINARYDDYVASSGNPQRLPVGVFPRSLRGGESTTGDLLYDCYASGQSHDAAILTAVGRSCGGYCPYCGIRLIGKPRNRTPDRDHILPRSKFPEFAVLSVNLAVCCDACNEGKQADYADAQGQWLWIHPYFDAFLSQPLLVGAVVATNSVLRVGFRLDLSSLSPADAARVERHANKLEVLRRMAEHVDDFIAVYVATLIPLTDNAPLSLLAGAVRSAARALLTKRPNDPLGVAVFALGNDEAVFAEFLGGFLAAKS